MLSPAVSPLPDDLRASMKLMATLNLADDLIAVLPGGLPGAEEQIRELAVLELYRRRVISSGRAAELVGMERGEFIRYASRLGIPYLDLDEIELTREIQGAATL